MRWRSIKTGQAHVVLGPSTLWAHIHLWLKYLPSWERFLCIRKHSWKRTRFEDVHAAPRTKGAVMPPALSPKDSYERELLQEKTWRLTLGKKQGMGRKPGKSAEGREVPFLNLGAAISRRACSIVKSAPTQATKNVPCFPGTNTLTIYCISPIPHHLSNLLK